MLEELAEVELSVSRYQSETSGTLHFSIPVTFGELFILPSLWEFHKKYPDMNVDLTLSERKVDLEEIGQEAQKHGRSLVHTVPYNLPGLNKERNLVVIE